MDWGWGGGSFQQHPFAFLEYHKQLSPLGYLQRREMYMLLVIFCQLLLLSLSTHQRSDEGFVIGLVMLEGT